MHIIRVRNVNSALPRGLAYLFGYGAASHSRAGDVMVAPGPVTTVYDAPQERVLFYPERDANPFFHFFEGLYFLAGRKDLPFLTHFIKDYGRFSDDGETLHASYGHRWRHHFDFDQVERIVALLRANPNSRRAVLQMWDPRADLREDEALRDVPCNQSIAFSNRLGKRDEPNRLCATVFCRSHDLIFGLTGANAVHMSMLQEYVAAQLGLTIGSMTTVSVNYHAYLDVYRKVARGSLYEAVQADVEVPCPYSRGEVSPYPMVADPDSWDAELTRFFREVEGSGGAVKRAWVNPFFPLVAHPLWAAHRAFKGGDMTGASYFAGECEASDWRRAALEWLARRVKGGS